MLILKKVSFVKRKLILGFKYVRFKPFMRHSFDDVSVKDVFNFRANKLAEILDCTASTAKLIILKDKSVLRIPYEDFVRNATFCKKHLKWGDIIDFPLIATNSGFLHHRYYSLMELGWADVSGRDIFRFQQLLKMTSKELRKQHYNLWYNNSSEHFGTFSRDYEFMKNSEVISKFQKMYEMDSSLRQIKESMNAEFLSYKLNCSQFRVQQIFNRYPPLRSQSILITSRLLDVLLKDYQIPTSKIFQVPTILSLHDEIATFLLHKIPYILGVKTLQIANKFPLFLRQSVEKVQQVEQVLKNFNISDDQLLCCPRIIAFSPRTLQKRLEDLCSSDNFLLMKSYKKFLWLVLQNNNLIPRLEALKAIDKPYSISVFLMSKTTFEKYIRFGSNCRTHHKDVFEYLAKVFNRKEHEVLSKLQEFPDLHNATINNCKRVIDYLLDGGASKKQLFNGLGVIIYDFDIVKLYFEELPTHSAYQPFTEWTSHYNLIQLLIYAIEVNSGFKGSKVYGPRTKSDYSEKLVISGYAR